MSPTTKKSYLAPTILTVQGIIYLIAALYSHSKGACQSFAWGGPLASIGEAEFMCAKYISFPEFFGDKYPLFIAEHLLILFVFLTLTYLLIVFYKHVKKHPTPLKYLALLQSNLATILLFSLTMFLILGFDGKSCLLDNCIETNLIPYLIFVLKLISLFTLIQTPLFIVLFIIPYPLVLIYTKITSAKNPKL